MIMMILLIIQMSFIITFSAWNLWLAMVLHVSVIILCYLDFVIDDDHMFLIISWDHNDTSYNHICYMALVIDDNYMFMWSYHVIKIIFHTIIFVTWPWWLMTKSLIKQSTAASVLMDTPWWSMNEFRWDSEWSSASLTSSSSSSPTTTSSQSSLSDLMDTPYRSQIGFIEGIEW